MQAECSAALRIRDCYGIACGGLQGLHGIAALRKWTDATHLSLPGLRNRLQSCNENHKYVTRAFQLRSLIRQLCQRLGKISSGQRAWSRKSRARTALRTHELQQYCRSLHLQQRDIAKSASSQCCSAIVLQARSFACQRASNRDAASSSFSRSNKLRISIDLIS